MPVCRNDSLKLYHLSQYSTESARIVPKPITIAIPSLWITPVGYAVRPPYSDRLTRRDPDMIARCPPSTERPRAWRSAHARMGATSRMEGQARELEGAQAEESLKEEGEGRSRRRPRRPRVPLLQEALPPREPEMQQRQGRPQEDVEERVGRQAVRAGRHPSPVISSEALSTPSGGFGTRGPFHGRDSEVCDFSGRVIPAHADARRRFAWSGFFFQLAGALVPETKSHSSRSLPCLGHPPSRDGSGRTVNRDQACAASSW